MTEFQREIISHLKHFDVVSFDVFDTLLLRPTMSPSDVFHIIEQETGSDGFASARIKAAKKSFDTARSAGREERTLHEIYQLMPQRFLELEECEKSVESRLLVANPEVLYVFNEAKRQGKRIIISSDMYLPKEFIAEVLKKNGISGWDAFYLSCELGARKTSGKLWEILIDMEKVEPSRILHIGDALDADFNAPRHHGIVSYQYEKVIDRFVHENPWTPAFLGKKSTLLRRNIVGSVAVAAHMYSICNDDVGFRQWFASVYLSVIGYSYSHFVVDDARLRGINKLLMIARDGYNIEPILNLIAPEIETRYVYAPRKDYLVIAQNFMDNSYESSRKFWRRKKRAKYEHRKIFVDLLVKHCEANGIELDMGDVAVFLKGGAPSCRLQKEMDAFSAVVKDEFSRYFDLLKISKEDKVGCVDITSVRGTAHRFLSMFSPTPIHAYYYFCNTGRDSDWNFDNSSAFIVGAPTLCRDSGMVEYFFSAPTAAIAAVRNLEPIYDDGCSFSAQIKKEVVLSVRAPIIHACALYKRWGILDGVDALAVTDYKEAVLLWVHSNCRSKFSFVQESYGVSNRLICTPFDTLTGGWRQLRLCGRVILSCQIFVKGLSRYMLVKLFNKIPILKLNIGRNFPSRNRLKRLFGN